MQLGNVVVPDEDIRAAASDDHNPKIGHRLKLSNHIKQFLLHLWIHQALVRIEAAHGCNPFLPLPGNPVPRPLLTINVHA
jgi:hypothetical protein